MKHLVHAAAVAAVLFGVPDARSQAQAQAEQGMPSRLVDQSGRPFGTPANPVAVTGGSGGSGSGAATTSPTALIPTTIATTGTYQQAAAAGKASTNGGILQTPAANAASVCVDISANASAGRTTPTGGQVCAAPGTSIGFPATAGGVFVYGAAGDTFSGSVS